MSTTIPERMSEMNCELDQLRKRLAVQKAILLGLVAIVVAVFCIGAASRDGHFDRVFAKSVIIRNATGDTAVQLYAVEGAGSLLIRDSSGEEAIHLISGAERNDLLIHDRHNGRIAVAVQGMTDRGRLSLHRTFASVGAAEEALGKRPREYFVSDDEKQVTVPVLRLPEPTHSHAKDRDEIHQILRLYEQMFVSENLDVLDEIFHPMAMLCWQSENPHTLSLEDCRIDLRETFGRRNYSGVKIYDTKFEITENVAKLTCKEIHAFEDVDFGDKYNVYITLVKSQGCWRILAKVTTRPAHQLSISNSSAENWRR